MGMAPHELGYGLGGSAGSQRAPSMRQDLYSTGIQGGRLSPEISDAAFSLPATGSPVRRTWRMTTGGRPRRCNMLHGHSAPLDQAGPHGQMRSDQRHGIGGEEAKKGGRRHPF